MSDSIELLQEEIEAAQASYIALTEDPDSRRRDVDEAAAKVKALKRALSAALVEGAEPCKACGHLPHGIQQPKGFDIGCLNCAKPNPPGEVVDGVEQPLSDEAFNALPPTFRSFSDRRRKAVALWNAGEFIPRRRSRFGKG